MKLLKRIIEAAFLMASIMLLASDNVWCWIAAIVPFAVFLLIVAWAEDTCDEWLYMK